MDDPVAEIAIAAAKPAPTAPDANAEADHVDQEEELLAQVPDDGSSIGNTTLRRELGWEDNQYWLIRNRLVDRGVLETGRGRGGSVRRVALAEVAPEGQGGTVVEAPPAEIVTKELDLYEPLESTLASEWVQDKRYENWMSEVTALQGGKITGGKWSRPDITIATMSTFPYVPGRHFDVITFEVKPAQALDVTAVYEALGHLRAATQAYVLLEVPEANAPDVLRDITSEAKKHGIGVITFSDPKDYDTWDEIAEPVRVDPDPRRLNDFLAKQLPNEHRERLIKWFK